ncbi:MAG: hypothetical protein DDT40_01678 [candidate division WS2 bacterium]|nr:hypothetical protein [Candidatus Psychracetigena formicireducens]
MDTTTEALRSPLFASNVSAVLAVSPVTIMVFIKMSSESSGAKVISMAVGEKPILPFDDFRDIFEPGLITLVSMMSCKPYLFPAVIVMLLLANSMPPTGRAFFLVRITPFVSSPVS